MIYVKKPLLLLRFSAIALFVLISIQCTPDSSYEVFEINPPEGYRSEIRLEIDPQFAKATLKEALVSRSFYRRPCYVQHGLKASDGSPFYFGSESFYFPAREKSPELELSSVGGFRTLSFKTEDPYLLATAKIIINFSESGKASLITVKAKNPSVYIGKIFNAHVGGMIPKSIPVGHLRLDEFALLFCIADFYDVNIDGSAKTIQSE